VHQIPTSRCTLHWFDELPKLVADLAEMSCPLRGLGPDLFDLTGAGISYTCLDLFPLFVYKREYDSPLSAG